MMLSCNVLRRSFGWRGAVPPPPLIVDKCARGFFFLLGGGGGGFIPADLMGGRHPLLPAHPPPPPLPGGPGTGPGSLPIPSYVTPPCSSSDFRIADSQD